MESLTKLLTLARSQKGLALHLSAHAYRSEKVTVGVRSGKALFYTFLCKDWMRER